MKRKTSKKPRKTWRDHEKTLAKMAREHPPQVLCSIARENTKIDIYFCEGIMRIVQFIIDEVKKKELGGAHNTFTIYFKHLDFGEDGVLEYTIDNARVDIYIEQSELKIQVKALSDVTVKDLEAQVAAVDARGVEDLLWIFFFYQFNADARPDSSCKYLLVRLSIDLTSSGIPATNTELNAIMQDAKKKAAEKLGVEHEILIPMPNLVSDIEQKRQLAEKEEIIAEKDSFIAEKEEIIAEKDNLIAEKNNLIAEKDNLIAEKDMIIAELKHKLEEEGKK